MATTIPNPLPVLGPIKFTGNLSAGSTVPSNSFAVATYYVSSTGNSAVQIYIGAGNSIPSFFTNVDGHTWKLLFSSVPYFTNS